MVTIETYRPEMLESWLRCRALSYMRSSFNDEITGDKEKITADNGVALVALSEGKVVGIADACFLDEKNIDISPRSYGLPAKTPLTTLDTVAVHPDFQHRGIATSLLKELVARLQKRGGYLIIYTLDDVPANKLYQSLGATLCYQASIVTGKSPKNRVHNWKTFFATPNRDVVIFDEEDNEVPYAKESETYYVGQTSNIKKIDNVTKIVTESVYLLEI